MHNSHLYKLTLGNENILYKMNVFFALNSEEVVFFELFFNRADRDASLDKVDRRQGHHSPILPIYPHYSAHYFLLEDIRYNARRISRRWAVLEVLLIAKIIR